MAITDLTGTKWLLNSSLNISIKTAYTINFVSNDINYAYFAIGKTPSSKDPVKYSLAYFTSSSAIGNSVYDGYADYWTNEAYRTVQFTGGTDATNTTLITWLGNNATQITLPVRSISLENLNTFKEELELEMALPTTTVAGKVLKSTTTAGTVQWGDDADTNYYHSTGAWSGLTYTATANGGTSCPELKFTIPTGTTSTTVAAGNHTHSTMVTTSSTLTANTIPLGNGSKTLKSSSYKVATNSTTWSDTSNVYLPTMYAIANYVNAKSTTIEIVDLTNA